MRFAAGAERHGPSFAPVKFGDIHDGRLKATTFCCPSGWKGGAASSPGGAGPKKNSIRGNKRISSGVLSASRFGSAPDEETSMNREDKYALDRRQTLECMIWAGTGILWTVVGGVPASRLITSAQAAEGGFSFAQISDSHIGFDKPANPDAKATLNEAIDKVLALPLKPAFMIHTGDVSHLAKPQQFDDAAQLIGRAKLDVHYSPGEHDILDPATAKAYLARFGGGATGMGWYSFDYGGVHFVSLVNVVDLRKNGLGYLGPDQLAWLADDLKDKTNSTPIVVFCHIPLWMIAPEWGWGTEDSAAALELLKRFGSLTVLNGHIHQVMQKVEGGVTFHTARSTAFPQPAPGTAPAPGPMLVPAGDLRKVLGVAEVVYAPTPTSLAITDTALAG